MLGLQACAVAMTGCLASFLLIGYHKIISKLRLLEWVTGIVRLINNILSIDWCLGCFNYMDSIKLNQSFFSQEKEGVQVSWSVHHQDVGKEVCFIL